jgi:hypothetical protein
VTFVLGETPALVGAVRVADTNWTAVVGAIPSGPRWRGSEPAGAMAAASAAPEGLRAAVPCIARSQTTASSPRGTFSQAELTAELVTRRIQV